MILNSSGVIESCESIRFRIAFCIVTIPTGKLLKIHLTNATNVTECQMMFFVVLNGCYRRRKYAFAQQTLSIFHQSCINFTFKWLQNSRRFNVNSEFFGFRDLTTITDNNLLYLHFHEFRTIRCMILQCTKTCEWHRAPCTCEKFF